jgi:hypothetical protein
MYFSRSQMLSSDRIIHFVIEGDSAPVSYADAIRLCQSDSDFSTFFIDLLRQSPFPAFRWETPPVTMATADRPFEFLLLDAPEVSLAPDPAQLAAYFDFTAPGEVVEFPNLGADAILISPCPDEPPADFGHLAAYLGTHVNLQQHQLWQAVGAAMQRRISSQPVWLNTAGGGGAWLHVRLDDRQKYYVYAPYHRYAA